MLPTTAANEREALKASVRFHRMVNLILSLTVLLGTLLLGYAVFHQRTVVVPPEVRRPYEVGAQYATPEYLMDMANYVLHMILTVTPESVDYQSQVILKMTAPDGYAVLKTQLEAAALRLKQEHISTIWIPQRETVHGLAVEVTGRFKTFMADTLTSTRDKTYRVTFDRLISGRIHVCKVEEISAAESHRQ